MLDVGVHGPTADRDLHAVRQLLIGADRCVTPAIDDPFDRAVRMHLEGVQAPLADPVGLGFRALTATPSGTLYAVGDGAMVVRRAP